jgi:hypothetical protein
MGRSYENFGVHVKVAQRVMEANLAKAQMELYQSRKRVEEQRMKDLEGVHSQDSQIFGKYLVNGSGETRKQVMFPVAFLNAPLVLTTAEIQSNPNNIPVEYEEISRQEWLRRQGRLTPDLVYTHDMVRVPKVATGLLHGEAPLIQSNIIGWVTEDNPPSDSKYIGVEIITVCEGVSGVKYIIHWSAAGTAYMNPAAGSMSNEFKDRITLGQLYGKGMP